MTSDVIVRRGAKASVYMAMRNQLLTTLREIDVEIDQVLASKKSQRAADRARALFMARGRLAEELRDYGIETDPHPAVANRE